LFRRLRRTRILRERLLSEEQWSALLSEHPILGGLTSEEGERLRELTTLFLHEKVFEHPPELELDDYRRAVICVQACLPVLNLGLDWYRLWKTVVVVPDQFSEQFAEWDEAGVVHEWEEDDLAGQRNLGVVVLSWRDVEDSGWGDNFNVVIHEAAHELDMTDGQLNGRPALHPGMNPAEWYQTFSAAYRHFTRGLQPGGRSRARRSRLDEYAAEDDVEFFGVVCETFFEQPHTLRSEYPDVYRLLAAFFKQDPSGRLPARPPKKRRR
jgi:Mlc titration factor MtfA (ptsG expression regulator)